MPLLPREPELFPEEIFDLSATDSPWRVAHVRSRQEKRLARHLIEHGVPFYLPQGQRRHESGGRVRTAYLPLFPGYVFFRGDREAALATWRSGVAATLIDVDDQQLLDAELRQIRELTRAGAVLAPHEILVAGDPVRVTSGAFAGYTGIIEREKGGERLIVRLSLLRKAVAVEFPRGFVKKA
jgi:transcription antitermination factor NusG